MWIGVSFVLRGEEKNTTRKGFKNLSVKQATHDKLVECANALECASIPDAIDTLATQFLEKKKSREDLRKLQERETRGS